MNIIKIKKKQNEFRTIYIPNCIEMDKLKKILPKLSKLNKLMCGNYVHGFIVGRNPVTNATPHIGYEFSISFDLKDFFDTIKPHQIEQYLSDEEIESCFIDGSPRQGLPTSPAIANLAAIPMDNAIIKFLAGSAIYTRYADDLTISFNDKDFIQSIIHNIPIIINACGFLINESKTKVMSAKTGRRIITGIAVGEDSVYPSRKSKRKLRAAKHRNKISKVNGLDEWCKCKLPKRKIEDTESVFIIITNCDGKIVDVRQINNGYNENLINKKIVPPGTKTQTNKIEYDFDLLVNKKRRIFL